MTKSHKFAMYTKKGNKEIARLAELMLEEQTILALDIGQVVHQFEQYIESKHSSFCAAHSEYGDTAVRDELYEFFEKRLGAPKFTNIVIMPNVICYESDLVPALVNDGRA
ncbi:MAG: hypothetical protein JW384_04228 [Nitrosomonadaceae bacterium]|nr:hypothetical protein [Nitrosomonadaceae bacterium]